MTSPVVQAGSPLSNLWTTKSFPAPLRLWVIVYGGGGARTMFGMSSLLDRWLHVLRMMDHCFHESEIRWLISRAGGGGRRLHKHEIVRTWTTGNPNTKPPFHPSWILVDQSTLATVGWNYKIRRSYDDSIVPMFEVMPLTSNLSCVDISTKSHLIRRSLCCSMLRVYTPPETRAVRSVHFLITKKKKKKIGGVQSWWYW